MNHRSSVLAAAVLAALTACRSTVDVPPVRPFGYLDVNTVSTQSGGYQVAAQGLFTKARIAGVIGSQDLSERCSQPSKIITGPAATDQPVAPGTVTMTLHGPVDTTTRTVSLRQNTIQTGTTTSAEQWVNDVRPSIKPGSDTVIYAATGVPGGFPPFAVRAPTVATFVPQPVADSVTGTGIRVQWTPSPTTASAMQISLQYADTAAQTSGIPNMEIVCVARDDGDFSINRTFLDQWEEAGVDSLHRGRQVLFSRFLTTTRQVADGLVTVVVRRDTLVVKP